ncbi:MAG: homocitrate synthase [Mycobacterium sp.]|nr:homocitrate synthase [Mycobacterium sp.]
MHSRLITDRSAPSTCFAARLDGLIPRALREQAATKSFDEFLKEYAPATGPLRLGQWACTDSERPSGRLGPQARNYQATLAVGDRIATARAAACGPVAALTEMLHARGVAVEVTAFHQLPAGQDTATFVRGHHRDKAEWAMGWSDDPVQSALSAVVACANRLLSPA